MGLIWAVVNEAFATKTPVTGLSGSYSTAAVVQVVFTVPIPTQASTNYRVNVTALNALSSAPFYVTNKTVTSFDVSYSAALTGTVAFDWLLIK
jgi:hypothetical protein